MKKTFVVLLDVGFWACYFIVMAIVLGVYYRSNLKTIGDPESQVVNAFKSLLLFAFFPSSISYYLYYYLLFPKYLQQKRILSSIFFGILISVGAATLGYILLRYFIETGQIIDMDEGGKYGRSTAGKVIFVMVIIGVICGVMGMVIKGFITWFNEIKLKEMLREKSQEMEMALIKSQLDPHLLFNTINNIDALILKDPVAGSDYLNKLSDIMRFVLYETKADKIPLIKEIKYIEEYIALQKIRTANEHYVQFAVTGQIGNAYIAPMIFIPFVENAFKHTNNKKLENAININIHIKNGETKLVCENKYDSTSVQRTVGGLGNKLIQKRLDLIYAGRHTIEVDKTNELYRVTLTILNG